MIFVGMGFCHVPRSGRCLPLRHILAGPARNHQRGSFSSTSFGHPFSSVKLSSAPRNSCPGGISLDTFAPSTSMVHNRVVLENLALNLKFNCWSSGSSPHNSFLAENDQVLELTYQWVLPLERGSPGSINLVEKSSSCAWLDVPCEPLLKSFSSGLMCIELISGFVTDSFSESKSTVT